jgi:hypothetical protein
LPASRWSVWASSRSVAALDHLAGRQPGALRAVIG